MYNMDSVPHMKKGKKNVLNALKVVYEMLSAWGTHGIRNVWSFVLFREKKMSICFEFSFLHKWKKYTILLLLECFSSFSFI